jgi:CubicO group peptidase (beta-lactamase class C family)
VKPSPLAAVAVALAVTAAASAPTVGRAEVESFRDPDRKAKVVAALPKVEERIAAEVAGRKLPGFAFGVVLDGELVYAKGFGVADLDDKRPVDADTVFRIGSITKTFTSLAILKLRDAGKLSLDDPVVRTLPELAALRYPTRDSAPITIRQLLTHTSALPQFGNHRHVLRDREVTERELFNDLPHLSLLWAPGTAFSYSTFGMALLGTVVTRLSGMR